MTIEQVLSQLSTTWAQLNVIERAEAVADCRQKGLSGHRIAKGVGCSESYLRYIAPVLELPEEQKEQIRQGAEVRPLLLAQAEQRRAAARKRVEVEAKKVCKVIEKWMDDQAMQWYRQQVVSEAFRYLRSLAQSPKDFALCKSYFPAPVLNGDNRPEGPSGTDQLNEWAKRLMQYLMHDPNWDEVFRQLQLKYVPV
jgi:hypothetical protein